MYVCGKNKGNRLFLSKKSSSNKLIPANIGNVSDIKFGPAHSVILKQNGDVLTSSGHKETLMNFSGIKANEGEYIGTLREISFGTLT